MFHGCKVGVINIQISTNKKICVSWIYWKWLNRMDCRWKKFDLLARLNGKQQILCARVHGICGMLIPEWEYKIGPIKHYSYCGPRRLHFWEPLGPKVTPTTIMWYSLANCHITMENHHHAIFMAKSTIFMGMASMSPGKPPMPNNLFYPQVTILMVQRSRGKWWVHMM